MQVIESFIESKTGNPECCEDAMFINEHFAAVIDGATSKAKMLPSGVTTGKKAAELIKASFPTIPTDAGPAEVMEALNQGIFDFYVEEGMLDTAHDEPETRLSAAVIVYSAYHRKIFSVGDGAALIDGTPVTRVKNVDRITAEARAFFLETEIRKGKTVSQLLDDDTGREFIFELLKRQCLFQNAPVASPYTYYVIDGFFSSDSNAGRIDLYPVPHAARELVLSSDGYPRLLPTLAETEAELSRIIAEDPLCFRSFKSTKGVYKGNVSFDDRTYIRIDVAEHNT